MDHLTRRCEKSDSFFRPTICLFTLHNLRIWRFTVKKKIWNAVQRDDLFGMTWCSLCVQCKSVGRWSRTNCSNERYLASCLWPLSSSPPIANCLHHCPLTLSMVNWPPLPEHSSSLRSITSYETFWQLNKWKVAFLSSPINQLQPSYFSCLCALINLTRTIHFIVYLADNKTFTFDVTIVSFCHVESNESQTLQFTSSEP